MQKMKQVLDNSALKIFYSWQSDLPSGETRSLIQRSIDDTVKLLRNTVAVIADRDTKGELGTPDINQTIFAKIDESDIFVADISIINMYYATSDKGDPIKAAKLSPNPNVLLELGYAAHVIGWDNVICIMNTDYGLPTDLPFDLEHRRPTQYSLKKTDKTEVRKYLQGIITDHVGSLLENGKRVKAKFSNIRVGSYQIANNEIIKTLIPWNPKEAPAYLTEKRASLEECKVLIEQINSIHLLPPQEIDGSPQEENEKSKQHAKTASDAYIWNQPASGWRYGSGAGLPVAREIP